MTKPAPAPPKACVIGYPVAHSRSPLIHGYWLETLGISGSYGREAVKPEDFPAFVASMRERGYVGGNCTVPHKEAAFRLVDRATERARTMQAVNTLWFEDGLLWGDNTDGLGFLAHLDDSLPGWRERTRTILVLGAGGAARGLVAVFAAEHRFAIRLANRTADRAVALSREFPGVTGHGWDAIPALLREADLVVNTTSLGMEGQPPLEIDLAPLRPSAAVADIVYVPLVTPLLAQAAARGHRTVDGLGMLLHQAVPGFERWFGRRPAVTPALRERIVADLLKPKDP
ncbi:shikimate dehydrogenase [Alsobacter sp. R-9]